MLQYLIPLQIGWISGPRIQNRETKLLEIGLTVNRFLIPAA